MAQSGYTPIAIYHSATPGAEPLAIDLVAGELALNTADGTLFYKDSSGVVQIIANGVVTTHTTWDAANSTLIIDGTGSVQVPSGTTAQEPATPAAGMLRFNTDTGGFEGFDGASWGGIGGAQAGGAIVTNKKAASISYTIDATENGFSVGPITIDDGVTITVASSSNWVII